eukprot:sb/3462391/
MLIKRNYKDENLSKCYCFCWSDSGKTVFYNKLRTSQHILSLSLSLSLSLFLSFSLLPTHTPIPRHPSLRRVYHVIQWVRGSICLRGGKQPLVTLQHTTLTERRDRGREGEREKEGERGSSLYLSLSLSISLYLSLSLSISLYLSLSLSLSLYLSLSLSPSLSDYLSSIACFPFLLMIYSDMASQAVPQLFALDCRYAQFCIHLTKRGVELKHGGQQTEEETIKIVLEELGDLMAADMVVPWPSSAAQVKQRVYQLCAWYDKIRLYLPDLYTQLSKTYSPVLWMNLPDGERRSHQLLRQPCGACAEKHPELYELSTETGELAGGDAMKTSPSFQSAASLEGQILEAMTSLPPETLNNILLKLTSSYSLPKPVPVIQPSTAAPTSLSPTVHLPRTMGAPAALNSPNSAISPTIHYPAALSRAAPTTSCSPTTVITTRPDMRNVPGKRSTVVVTNDVPGQRGENMTSSFMKEQEKEMAKEQQPRGGDRSVVIKDVEKLPPSGVWIVQVCRYLFNLRVGSVLNPVLLAAEFAGATAESVIRLSHILGVDAQRVEHQAILAGFSIFKHKSFDKRFAYQIAKRIALAWPYSHFSFLLFCTAVRSMKCDVSPTQGYSSTRVLQVAVHQLYQQKGAGEELLIDALTDIMLQAHSIHKDTPSMKVAKLIILQQPSINNSHQSTSSKRLTSPQSGSNKRRRKGKQSASFTSTTAVDYNGGQGAAVDPALLVAQHLSQVGINTKVRAELLSGRLNKRV